jgi:hypothetical protein
VRTLAVHVMLHYKHATVQQQASEYFKLVRACLRGGQGHDAQREWALFVAQGGDMFTRAMTESSNDSKVTATITYYTASTGGSSV